jgi:rod shape-determining protein MreC
MQMPEFVRRHSLFITSLFLLVVSSQLMTTSVKDRRLPSSGSALLLSLLSPIEKLHSEALQTVSAVWSRYLALVEVGQERDALAQRIKALESRETVVRELEAENNRLRELLDFRTKRGNQGVVASVVGRDPSNWAKTMTVDKGLGDGVRVGMAVVDGNAVVGQVIVVTTSSARVLLLTDNASAIDTVVQGSRARGIAEGTLQKKLRLRYVGKEYGVQVGERVIASGLDGVFPKGVLVGTVSAVDASSAGLFQRVELDPAVDPNLLETVMIVNGAEEESMNTPQPGAHQGERRDGGER